MRYSPWADAAQRHPDVHIERCDIAPARGAWVAEERVILLGEHLDVASRRCALAHEVAHIDLRHRPVLGWFGHRQEAEADQLASRRLIPLDHLADALTWARCLDEAAEELWVDTAMLETRLAHLHPSERHYLAARLARREDGA